jgi:hypothetical protein
MKRSQEEPDVCQFVWHSLAITIMFITGIIKFLAGAFALPDGNKKAQMTADTLFGVSNICHVAV